VRREALQLAPILSDSISGASHAIGVTVTMLTRPSAALPKRCISGRNNAVKTAGREDVTDGEADEDVERRCDSFRSLARLSELIFHVEVDKGDLSRSTRPSLHLSTRTKLLILTFSRRR
jgi:hypothetical protein